MIEIGLLPLLALVELTLVGILVAIALGVYMWMAKQRARAGAKALVSRVKEDAKRREDETRKLLSGRFALEGEDLENLVSRIGREEKLFYQNQITTFLRRDGEAFANLLVDTEALVQPYRELPEQSAAPVVDAVATGEPKDGAGGGADPAELQRLQDENKRLSDELRITMETMGRMLNEYSSMFAGGAGAGVDKDAMMAQFRAEAAEAVTGGSGDSDEIPAEATREGDGQSSAAEDSTAGDSATDETVVLQPDESPGVEQDVADALADSADEVELSVEDDLEVLMSEPESSAGAEPADQAGDPDADDELEVLEDPESQEVAAQGEAGTEGAVADPEDWFGEEDDVSQVVVPDSELEPDPGKKKPK